MNHNHLDYLGICA